MSNLVVLCALVCVLSVQHLLVSGFMRGGLESPTGSFVRVTETGDGQRETVVSWGGFLAVEYVVEARHIHGQVSAREMTNGHDMLRLFFKGRGNLLDCELFEGDAIQVAEFFRSYSNRTRKVEDGSGLSEVLDRHPEIDRTLLDWEASKESCVRMQHEAQKLVEDEVDRKTGHENEVKVPSRSRRGISLMWPGTTWCGVGNRSRDNAETEGVHVDTDKCCRQHDLCNYTIEAFTTKYNMLNFRFHTISHCECDDRFRTCLRMAGSPHSDTVGRLFFNILGMKCFIFEKEIVCKERNWWGKCIRQGYEYTAKLRESVPYYNE